MGRSLGLPGDLEILRGVSKDEPREEQERARFRNRSLGLRWVRESDQDRDRDRDKHKFDPTRHHRCPFLRRRG
jgi:hypothetical protein